MKLVYRAADIIEAHIVSGMLEANGVPAQVSGHYLQGAIGELAALDFARVFVADDDVALAMPLIREYENNKAPAHAEAGNDADAEDGTGSPEPGLGWHAGLQG